MVRKTSSLRESPHDVRCIIKGDQDDNYGSRNCKPYDNFETFPTVTAPWKGQSTGWKVYKQETRECG